MVPTIYKIISFWKGGKFTVLSYLYWYGTVPTGNNKNNVFSYTDFQRKKKEKKIDTNINIEVETSKLPIFVIIYLSVPLHHVGNLLLYAQLVVQLDGMVLGLQIKALGQKS